MKWQQSLNSFGGMSQINPISLGNILRYMEVKVLHGQSIQIEVQKIEKPNTTLP